MRRRRRGKGCWRSSSHCGGAVALTTGVMWGPKGEHRGQAASVLAWGHVTCTGPKTVRRLRVCLRARCACGPITGPFPLPPPPWTRTHTAGPWDHSCRALSRTGGGGGCSKQPAFVGLVVAKADEKEHRLFRLNFNVVQLQHWLRIDVEHGHPLCSA